MLVLRRKVPIMFEGELKKLATIERDVFASITNDDILQYFQELKSRLKKLPELSSTSSYAHRQRRRAPLGLRLRHRRGYSLTKSALPNGKRIVSRPFRVAGRTWAINYFPNGDRPETADYISLFLVLKDPTAGTVLARFKFSFVDQVEKQQPSYVANSTAHMFLSNSPNDGVWVYKKFIKRETLEKSGRLKDDCFTVRCDVINTRELSTEDAMVPAAAPPFVVVPPPDLPPQHFRALLLGGKGADVRLIVGSEVFAAHRRVLAARSPVFDALFFGPMKEGVATDTESCVRIDGMLPQVFQSLLHFIYTDSLPESEEGQDDDEAGATMAQHLLEAADSTGVVLLMRSVLPSDDSGAQVPSSGGRRRHLDSSRCGTVAATPSPEPTDEQRWSGNRASGGGGRNRGREERSRGLTGEEGRLCQHIDVSIVATTLALAVQHCCQGLKEACFAFLKSPKTLDKVIATDGFQHLAKSSPALFELMSKLAER
ncbi:BTB/POZ and MATH domain-containing protein 1-like [Panicum miliaceum]|uniref:BTB/POZ and MATH domain-containing protein 1-like n=1 Tax=Panicum miliaceum TaxID=4540 RepID=A0A3L6TKY8_PANMI|nr:BTB/POZ and MATH domain-containing protein 1-like [Panicum miliaceum]